VRDLENDLNKKERRNSNAFFIRMLGFYYGSVLVKYLLSKSNAKHLLSTSRSVFWEHADRSKLLVNEIKEMGFKESTSIILITKLAQFCVFFIPFSLPFLTRTVNLNKMYSSYDLYKFVYIN